MKYHRLAIFLLSALLIVAGTIRADEKNKKSVFTFQDPVQVPGTVLPPGTYVFKLASSQSDRHIVQIYNQDESQLIATILTIPNSQLEPAGSTILMYAQTPPDEPQALEAWFYPGDNTGQQFVYPRRKAAELSSANAVVVPSTDDAQAYPEVVTQTAPASESADVQPAVAQVRISVAIAPPLLPVYEQPICPGDGYIWTPGYWAWGDDDYYWVPGTWVLAPEVGFYWTPPYWGWDGGAFIFYDGYWGPEVGFYGGVVYGFGYFGFGYEGGRWENGHFFYNTAVNRIDTTVIRNVYNTRVNITNNTRVSYNGGNGGLAARPSAREEAYARERHAGPVAAQVQHVRAARGNTQLRDSANHGNPGIAATSRPGEANDRGTVATRTENTSRTPIHPNDIQRAEPRPAPNTGDANLDKKYQQEQEELRAKHEGERQNLQQEQDKEHQQLAKQKADDAQKQQLEQRHQQQTQELVQRHADEQHQLEQRQAQRPNASKPEPRP